MPYMMESKSKFKFLSQSVSFTHAGSHFAATNKYNIAVSRLDADTKRFKKSSTCLSSNYCEHLNL